MSSDRAVVRVTRSRLVVQAGSIPTSGYDPAGTAAAAVAAHVAAADPHPGYVTTAEGELAYDPRGSADAALASATVALAAHVAAADPHPGYVTTAEGAALVAAHVGDSDPHPGYALESALGTIATQAANNVAITGGSVTGITDLAIADGGTGASTAAGARTNLELDNPLYVPQVVASTAAFSSTSTSVADITGASYVPPAGALLLVEWRVVHSSAINTTGATVAFNLGNAQYGGGEIRARGLNSGSATLYVGELTTGANSITGTSAPNNPGRAPLWGWAICKADATTPTAIKLQAATEVGGSQIDIAAGEAVLVVRRIS